MSSLTVTDSTLHRFAEEVGAEGPIAVAGNRTRWTHGGELDSKTLVVSAPTGIVTYQPAEMTVQVRAGTTVADLHSELSKKGQRTALPERGGTVGGALAVGENDVSVAGVGPVRNTLLQLRYVSAEGKVITGGGPTVKNVSGYSLPNLMIGSLGTLGLFAEVILRTNPGPAQSVWLRSDDADPFNVYSKLYHPSAVLWDGTSTWVQLEGHEVDVAAERNALAAEATFVEVEAAPDLPQHRWSATPAGLRNIDPAIHQHFVAVLGVGTIFSSAVPPNRSAAAGVETISNRAKALFDPQGRLSPGRNPWKVV